MDSKKVPGEGNKNRTASKIVSTEIQLADLHGRLAGNPNFKDCRGKFDWFPHDTLLGTKLKDGRFSPSAVLKNFKRWSATIKPMLCLLAKYKRDGWMVAYSELLKALREYEYIITGETVPLERTKPGVLLIFNSKQVFLTTRFMYTSHRKDATKWSVDNCNEPNNGQCGALTPAMIEMFPELAVKLSDRDWLNYRNPIETFLCGIDGILERLRGSFCQPDVYGIYLDSHKIGDWRGRLLVGAFVTNHDQGEVLKLFSRGDQDNLATWGFRYPEILCRKMNTGISSTNLYIGIHPEAEHSKWSKQWPSFASSGCSHSHGAVLIDDSHKIDTSYLDNEPLVPRYETLNGAFPQYCNGNLATRSFVICFPYNC